MILHLKRERPRRAHRGIHRLTHYPAGEHEDFIVLWLWSERADMFTCGQTLLAAKMGISSAPA